MVSAIAESYIACCSADLELIQASRCDVQHLLDSDELVDVLPSQRAGSTAISAVYPHRRQLSRRLSAFIGWFETLIRPHLESPAA